MEINQENSKRVFENWINAFGDDLFSWAFYKTSSKETAEDLVQDTFLSAFNNLNGFEGKSQPKTWLFAILNHKIIDYYRKNAKRKLHGFQLTEVTGFQVTDDLFDETNNWRSRESSPIWDQEEELLDNADFNSVLANCLDHLPEKWKTAITSKYLTDKKANEICQDLQITVSNYWQIIHRAKLLLKKCLESNCSKALFKNTN